MKPSEMLALVTPVMGLAAWHGDQKVLLAKQEIYEAALQVFNHRPWSWRWVTDWEAVTVASQSYVLLPDDCGHQYRVNGKLLYSGEPRETGVREVDEINFQNSLARWPDVSKPREFCVRQRYITVSPAVVDAYFNVLDFAPIPDGVYTLLGFQYPRILPAVSTWDWDATDPDIFPYPEFNILWRSLVMQKLAAISPAIATFVERTYTERAYDALMARCEDQWAPKAVSQSQTLPEDVYHTLEDLQSTAGIE